MVRITIDIEPMWKDIYRAVETGHIKLKNSGLDKIAKTADILRQAQKREEYSLVTPEGYIHTGSKKEILGALR